MPSTSSAADIAVERDLLIFFAVWLLFFLKGKGNIQHGRFQDYWQQRNYKVFPEADRLTDCCEPSEQLQEKAVGQSLQSG